MNADHDRIIAEFCGWHHIHGQFGVPPTISQSSERYHLPRYSSSLGAIAEAEGRLTDEQHCQFRMRLSRITDGARGYLSATAAQRAAALAQVIQATQKNEN